MTVTPTSYAPLVYNGNGATTEFSVSFPYYEITVTHIDSAGTETTWVENTQFTTGVNDGNGSTGTVTVKTTPTDYTPASGEQLRIERTTTRSQATDYETDNQVFEDALQEVSDRLTMIIQEEIYHATRSARLSLQDMATYGALTLPSPVAGKAIGWNSTPDALVNVDVKDIYVQASAPTGSIVESSLWIDSDSTDYDLYQYTSGSWSDTGVNLKGATGDTGATGPVDTSGTPVLNDYARFTDADTIEGRSVSEAQSDLDIATKTNNLSDLADAPTARSNLGLGALATAGSVNDSNWSGTDLAVGNGGTGASTAAGARTNLGLVIGTDVQAYDADTLKSDEAKTLTAGFKTTEYDAGTQSSGTFTPDPDNGNIQEAVNGGAHTLAPPSNTCTMVIQYTNNASAGSITVSGFTITSGDSFTTTNGDDFFAYITKIGTFSHLHVKALQ